MYEQVSCEEAVDDVKLIALKLARVKKESDNQNTGYNDQGLKWMSNYFEKSEESQEAVCQRVKLIA